MSNVLAIAHKELRSYFASPIAYIVIGFFALLFGWFYIEHPRLVRPAGHADGPDGHGPVVDEREPADDPAAAS